MGANARTTSVVVLALVALAGTSVGMDGTSVTVVQGGGTVALKSYTIQNNAVASQKTLYSQSQPLNSPSINPSGTHAMFYRGSMKGGKIYPLLAIVNLETGAWKDVCPIQDSLFGYLPVIWWLHDGSVVVWINWCALWKFELVKQGSATTVNVSLYGRFDHFPQHQYVDLSMDGRIISYRTYDPPCVSPTKLSSQFIGPIPSDPNTLMGQGAPGFKGACGCGNAVSPDGSVNGCFQGSGHEVCTYQNTATSTTLYQVNNLDSIRVWCNCGLRDTTYGGTDFGHGWSVNSTKWTVVSLGCDNRFANTGSEQFLLNASERKAIDVTRNCLDNTGKQAHRGDLWVGNQADVDAAYWSYVQNRDQQQTYWDDIMAGLPDSARPATPATSRFGAGRVAAEAAVVQVQTRSIRIRCSEATPVVAELYDVRGMLVASVNGSDGETVMDLRGRAGGYYLLRLTSSGLASTRRIAIPR